MTRKLSTIVFVIFAILIPLALQPVPVQAHSPLELTGVLNIVWGDAEPETSSQPITIFSLQQPDHSIIPLEIKEPLPLPVDQLLALNGQSIIVKGYWNVSQQFFTPNQAFQVESIQAGKPGAASQSVLAPELTGSHPWVSILCKFQGETATLKPPSYFQGMFASTSPGLDHYWREVSYNNINTIGSTATTQWYDLPHPHDYYMSGGSFNLTSALNDCTAAADADINYTPFDGINLMFSNNLDSYAYGGFQYLTLDGVTRSWRITWEPPWGYSNIAVIEHEMGHGFGFPHSAYNDAKTYDNVWDVMSDTWTGCSGFSDPTYGCKGQHTISYHKNLGGWIASGQKTAVNYGIQTTLTLEQLAQPQTNNLLMVTVPIPGTSHFYTIEVRRKVGYDAKLPANAVIIHEVDPSRMNPAHVIDIDGNGNTADAGAEWIPGETFFDIHGIWIRINSATATGYVVTINNNHDNFYLPFIRR